MRNRLAIVIPAYKDEFFRKTLISIKNQTCKYFTLYIGDDASPFDLCSIISEFENSINIVYKRFENNIGGKDLISQWNRCIDLIYDEEWIWLFSDDDIMDNDCVEKFYDTLDKNQTANFVHFNTVVIDEHDHVIQTSATFPEHLEVNVFFAKRINFKLNSYVVDYIFKRSLFNETGGFKNYDLAWCSDDATWIKFGQQTGILTIPEAKIHWRYSGANISSNLKDRAIVLRKINSNITHIQWVTAFFKTTDLSDETTKFQKLKWTVSPILLTKSFSLKEKKTIMINTINHLGYKYVKAMGIAYLFYWTIKINLQLFKVFKG